ncbi:PD40 domain-containing protein [candidate division WOR-3 bacterium]|nr:PD40 domain-containing protein [candidate division WOR-3 bacterium]
MKGKRGNREEGRNLIYPLFPTFPFSLIYTFIRSIRPALIHKYGVNVIRGSLRPLPWSGLFLVLLFIPAVANAQYWEFGQNKVQYKNFDWKVIDTDEFSIIYYSGGERLAKFANQVLLDSYKRYSQILSYTPKEPIPVIIYKSHNDFEQTNITLSLIDEATGGFTEIFKNRVVIPFDGSYEKFRHVLAHELVHAFQFAISQGTGIASILPKINLFAVPLWFIEGMAEYFSLDWDAESDMVIRDALYYSRLKPIQQLELIAGSYLMYKEGQSILKFIADRYGERKIGEIFHKIGAAGGLNKALQAVIGVDTEELNRLWMNDLKKRYWLQCAELEESPVNSKKLTNHKNYTFNTAPSISPDGTEIAFLSDRDEYESLWLMSSINGRIKDRLLKGGKSKGFESLHIMQGGISWSPDGKNLAFVAKGAGKDILYIMNVHQRKIIKKIPFCLTDGSPRTFHSDESERAPRSGRQVELDQISSPSFSPSGQEIAFRGLKDGKADIYVLNINTGNLKQLTSDEYDDLTPSWLPDGKFIVFTSDRPLEGENWHYGYYTIFKVGAHELLLQKPVPLIKTRATYVASPIWFQDKILFVSNQTGANNLYILDIESSDIIQLTNVVGGVFTPSISKNGKYLAFSLYTNGGWDVYLIKKPFQKGFEYRPLSMKSEFDRQYVEVKTDTSILKVKKLGIRFTPDWGGGAISYVSGCGILGNLRLAVSDLLGNHRFYLETNSPENLAANYYLSYLYLPKRLDFGGAIFKEEHWFLIGDTLEQQKYKGCGLLFEYPLDKFHRFDLELNGSLWETVIYSWPEEKPLSPKETFYLFSPSLSYVIDNTRWGATGPQNGERGKLMLRATLPLISPTLLYNFYELDFRKYIRIAPRYSFAIRFINAGIWGKDKESVNLLIGGPDDLRGYEIHEFKGKNVGILNLELRYPFIDKLKIAFPISLSIGGVRGALFCDFGYAVPDPRKFKPFKNGGLNSSANGLKFDFGTGIRIRFPYFILKFDIAKNTDFLSLSKTYWYFSLGPEF